MTLLLFYGSKLEILLFLTKVLNNIINYRLYKNLQLALHAYTQRKYIELGVKEESFS